MSNGYLTDQFCGYQNKNDLTEKFCNHMIHALQKKGSALNPNLKAIVNEMASSIIYLVDERIKEHLSIVKNSPKPIVNEQNSTIKVQKEEEVNESGYDGNDENNNENNNENNIETQVLTNLSGQKVNKLHNSTKKGGKLKRKTAKSKKKYMRND